VIGSGESAGTSSRNASALPRITASRARRAGRAPRQAPGLSDVAEVDDSYSRSSSATTCVRGRHCHGCPRRAREASLDSRR
jgi:hypothetical protein